MTTTNEMLFQRVEAAEAERDDLRARLDAADKLVASLMVYLPSYWQEWLRLTDEQVNSFHVPKRYLPLLRDLRAYTATPPLSDDGSAS